MRAKTTRPPPTTISPAPNIPARRNMKSTPSKQPNRNRIVRSSLKLPPPPSPLAYHHPIEPPDLPTPYRIVPSPQQKFRAPYPQLGSTKTAQPAQREPDMGPDAMFIRRDPEPEASAAEVLAVCEGHWLFLTLSRFDCLFACLFCFEGCDGSVSEWDGWTDGRTEGWCGRLIKLSLTGWVGVWRGDGRVALSCGCVRGGAVIVFVTTVDYGYVFDSHVSAPRMGTAWNNLL